MIRTAALQKSIRNERFTPIEASWLTDLPCKSINRIIDRDEFGRVGRARSGSRLLGIPELLYLALRNEVGNALSPEARAEVYASLRKLPPEDLAVKPRKTVKKGPGTGIELAGGALRIDLRDATQRLATRMAELRNVERAIVSDPDVRGGEPVFRGTRIPVYTIAALVEQGAEPREILEDYPSLRASGIRAAVVYAATRPKRGRPRKAPWRA
jgi:uncharacterized protein (DUF433 family)